MHLEFLVRAIWGSSFELTAVEFEYQWPRCFRCVAFPVKGDLELEDGVFFRHSWGIVSACVSSRIASQTHSSTRSSS